MPQSHHFVFSLPLILYNNNYNEVAGSVTTFGFRKDRFSDISTLCGWDNNIIMIIIIMHFIDYVLFLHLHDGGLLFISKKYSDNVDFIFFNIQTLTSSSKWHSRHFCPFLMMESPS